MFSRNFKFLCKYNPDKHPTSESVCCSLSKFTVRCELLNILHRGHHNQLLGVQLGCHISVVTQVSLNHAGISHLFNKLVCQIPLALLDIAGGADDILCEPCGDNDLVVGVRLGDLAVLHLAACLSSSRARQC